MGYPLAKPEIRWFKGLFVLVLSHNMFHFDDTISNICNEQILLDAA